MYSLFTHRYQLLSVSAADVNIRKHLHVNTVEFGYNVVRGAEYFLSLKTSVVVTEEYNVMVNSKELIDTTEYQTL
jgi:hypothetical protein